MRIEMHYESEPMPNTVEHLIELREMLGKLTLDQLVGEYDIEVVIKPSK